MWNCHFNIKNYPHKKSELWSKLYVYTFLIKMYALCFQVYFMPAFYYLLFADADMANQFFKLNCSLWFIEFFFRVFVVLLEFHFTILLVLSFFTICIVMIVEYRQRFILFEDDTIFCVTNSIYITDNNFRIVSF